MADVHEVARFFNRTPRWVQGLAARGIFPRDRRGEFDLPRCALSFIRYAHRQLRDRGVDPNNNRAMRAAIRGAEDLRSARQRLVAAQAGRAEIALAVARGELVPIALIKRALIEQHRVARERLLSVPSREAVHLEGLPAEELRRRLEKILAAAIEPAYNAGKALANAAASERLKLQAGQQPGEADAQPARRRKKGK